MIMVVSEHFGAWRGDLLNRNLRKKYEKQINISFFIKALQNAFVCACWDFSPVRFNGVLYKENTVSIKSISILTIKSKNKIM